MTQRMAQQRTSNNYRLPQVSDYCPLCSHKLPTKGRPFVDLNSNCIIYKGKAWRVTPTHAELLTVLLEVWPRFATREYLLSRIHPTGNSGSENLISALLSGARYRIKGSGVAVKVVQGIGYKINWE